MDHRENYSKLGVKRWRRGARGFRLSCHRFSVRRLRARVLAIFGLFGRCFKSLLTEGSGSRRGQQRCYWSSSCRGLVVSSTDVGAGRRRRELKSNSFNAEAIADCLDFIRRNSVSSSTTSEDTDGGSTSDTYNIR